VRFHRFLLLGLLTCTPPSTASADWLITPFLGMKFAGETSFVDIEQGVGRRKLTFGGSVALQSDRFLGIEADFGHTLGFFEREGRGEVVASSRVSTLMGSMVVAVPLTITRESLRPYVVGGLGLLHARNATAVEALDADFGIDRNLFGMNVGFGAIGLVSNRAGYRFELRHFRSLSDRQPAASGLGTTALKFWRLSVGVTLRY
jgi:opacity protein-like surface antigen